MVEWRKEIHRKQRDIEGIETAFITEYQQKNTNIDQRLGKRQIFMRKIDLKSYFR